MAERNYALFVAAYEDEGSAQADFTAIKSLEDTSTAAAVVLSRDSYGKVEVKEHGGGLVKRGTAIGAASGLVVGLFAPPLLLSGVVGAGIGAGSQGNHITRFADSLLNCATKKPKQIEIVFHDQNGWSNRDEITVAAY